MNSGIINPLIADEPTRKYNPRTMQDSTNRIMHIGWHKFVYANLCVYAVQKTQLTFRF